MEIPYFDFGNPIHVIHTPVGLQPVRNCCNLREININIHLEYQIYQSKNKALEMGHIFKKMYGHTLLIVVN